MIVPKIDELNSRSKPNKQGHIMLYLVYELRTLILISLMLGLSIGILATLANKARGGKIMILWPKGQTLC